MEKPSRIKKWRSPPRSKESPTDRHPLISWNKAKYRFQRHNNQKEVIPCHSSPAHLSTNYKSIINIWHMLYQIATNKKHGFPLNDASDRYDKILKLLKIQLFLKRSNQIREHGWLCKWNHKLAYQCLPILKKLSWVLLPRVEFWSKETDRHSDKKPGASKHTRGKDIRLYIFIIVKICIILFRAEFPFGCQQLG